MKDDFEQLLLILSGSLIQTPPWEAFLREMESYFQCQNCVLFLRTPTEDDSGLLISQERTISSPSELVETYQLSPFLEMPEGRILSLCEVRKDKRQRQRFSSYLDFHQRKETRDILALNLVDEESGMRFYFRLVRYSHPRKFSERDKARLLQLLPHLKIATAVYCQLVSQQQQIYISDKTTTTLGFGFVVLKRDGQIATLNDENQIQMLNSAAAQLIREKKGIAIERGKLVCVDKQADSRLRRSIKSLLAPGQDETTLNFEIPCTAGDGKNLALMLKTFSMPTEFRDDNGPLVSLVIRDVNEKIELSPGLLTKMFGFTPAEAQLAERLVLGDSLAEAAKELGRSKSTVRAQLSALFAKTDTHKQHQLISYIMHSASNQWP